MTGSSDDEQQRENDKSKGKLQAQSGDQEHKGFSERALGASTKIVEENGRWVVYLNVDFWEPPSADEIPDEQANDENWPVTTHWKRISDYADRRSAEVAAKWIERSADRNLRRPPSGL